MDNTKLIAEIRTRANAATPGPWRHWPEAGDIEITTEHFLEVIASSVRPRLGWGEEIYAKNSEPDAEFIAHSREDIPALIEALEAAEAELTRQRERVEEWRRIAATNRREADEQRIATRAAVRDSVWSVMEDRLEDDIDLDLNDVTESARFNALVDSVVDAAIAAAPVSLEAVKADHDHEFEDRCYCGLTAADHFAERDNRG